MSHRSAHARASSPDHGLGELALWATVVFGLGTAAGFVLGELVGGVSSESITSLVRRWRGTAPSPSEVTSQTAGQVRRALTNDSVLQDLELEVLPAGRGSLELHGWALNRTQRARAIRVATSAAGAFDIVNSILVRGEDDFPREDFAPEEPQSA